MAILPEKVERHRQCDWEPLEMQAHLMLTTRQVFVMDNKSRDILKAIAAGHSCKQILVADSTLTYHDIFHVLAESPTSHWRKVSARNVGQAYPGNATSRRTPARD